jgi:nicotinamidase-related amidase
MTVQVSIQAPLGSAQGAPMPLTLADYVTPQRCALVLWDFQKGLAGKAPAVAQIQPRAAELIAAADAAGVMVIWSRHILPPLDLTVGPFLQFLMKKQKATHPEQLKPTMQEGMEDTEFLDGMRPAPHHLVLQKSMPSLFVDTPLDARLKARGITTLVLCGVATDIGVEFTARHAMAKGYYSVIAEDATAAYTDASQARSMAFMREYFPVSNAAEICRLWASAPSS